MPELALWTSKSGLDVQNRNMEAISHNLANINTTGYKKSRIVVEDLPYQNIRQAGSQEDQNNKLPSGLQIGTGAKVVATQKMFSQGSQTSTSNPLDMAINGDGFFQILQADGSTAYTRDGGFQLNADGQLVTAQGEQLQPSMTIPTGAKSISISNDGIVSVMTADSPDPTQVGQLELATFINPAGLQAIGDNKFIKTAASGEAQTANPADTSTGMGSIVQGALETSNVNMVEELVNLIQAQRAYEINGKGLDAVNRSMQFITNQVS